MCNAVAAMMGLQVAGGIMSAGGEERKAEASKRYYYYLAAQNEVEAGITEKRADQTVTGIQDEAFMAEKDRVNAVRKLEGVQRTTLAAHGIGGGSKLAEYISMDTFNQSERDAAALRYNANVKSYEARVSASDRARALRGQASAYRVAGDNAIDAGDINSRASILGSATNVADTWLRYSQTSKGA